MREFYYDARMETARVHQAPQPPSLDSFDRLPIGPVVESSHLAPVVVLR